MWRNKFKKDPIPILLNASSDAIVLRTRQDLLAENVDIHALETLTEPQKLIRSQQSDGRWRYKGRTPDYHQADYDQLETYRNLAILVEKFSMDRTHSAIASSAEFLFSRQTGDGDFRGIYELEYVPTYTASIVEELIRAGYDEDRRVMKAFKWLESLRQNDGGWAAPLRTRGISNTITYFKRPPEERNSPLEPDRSKPFAHLVTGMVLRAYAMHPRLRESEIARRAADLMVDRLFERDAYSDRQGKQYWLKVSFPFWFPDLLSVLDSLSLMKYSPQNPKIAEALQCVIDAQDESGMIRFHGLRSGNKNDFNEWILFVASRIVKRFYN